MRADVTPSAVMSSRFVVRCQRKPMTKSERSEGKRKGPKKPVQLSAKMDTMGASRTLRNVETVGSHTVSVEPEADRSPRRSTMRWRAQAAPIPTEKRSDGSSRMRSRATPP